MGVRRTAKLLCWSIGAINGGGRETGVCPSTMLAPFPPLYLLHRSNSSIIAAAHFFYILRIAVAVIIQVYLVRVTAACARCPPTQ
jgi:hypothetical protein